MARWPIASMLVVVACGSEPKRTAVGPLDPAGGTGVGVGPTPIEPNHPEVTARPPRGAPHGTMVMSTAVSQGGTAALSRDAQGEVRVWPTLDGTVAPRAVQVRNVMSMRIQDGGPAGAEILAGFAETSGGGHLVRFDRGGNRLGVAEISGPGAVLQVTPLGDASGAIVLFADHSLALVAPDGTTRSTLSRRATRMRAIEALGQSDAMVVLRVSEGDGSTDHLVARVESAGGTLAFTHEVELPLEPLEPIRFAVAPDGKRIAYTRDPDDKTARREAERRAARRRPDPKGAGAGPGVAGARAPRPAAPQQPSKIAVVDTGTGADVTPEELALQAYTDVTALGFSAPARLHVFDTGQQSQVDVVAGVVVSGSLVRASGAAVANELLVTGFDVSLVTQVPDGATRYLGWQSNMPQRVALSFDGSRAAWASARGELMIETLDGSQEIYGGLYDAPISLVSFVGERHVLVGSGRGSIHLVDAATGKEVSSLMPPGPLHGADLDVHTGWLAGLRPGGGVWMVKITPDGQMPTTTMAVADGAVQFALLSPSAPGGPVLLTADNKHTLRRYTEAELVAGVSAKSIRERPTEILPRAMAKWDHHGRGYALEGRKILVFDGAAQSAAISLAFDPIDILVAADGSAMVVLDRQNAVTRVAPDGKTLWTATIGPGGRWWWDFAPDGKRFALVGGGGGIVLDTATGERVTASCAWRFGISSAPPMSRAVGAIPLCQ